MLFRQTRRQVSIVNYNKAWANASLERRGGGIFLETWTWQPYSIQNVLRFTSAVIVSIYSSLSLLFHRFLDKVRKVKLDHFSKPAALNVLSLTLVLQLQSLYVTQVCCNLTILRVTFRRHRLHQRTEESFFLFFSTLLPTVGPQVWQEETTPTHRCSTMHEVPSQVCDSHWINETHVVCKNILIHWCLTGVSQQLKGRPSPSDALVPRA